MNDMKSDLINHGDGSSSSPTKKEESVQLYEQNMAVREKTVIDFSGDDEEVSFPGKSNISKKKVYRKSEGANATDENSLIVGDVDVATFSNDELAEKLKEFDITVGPIVGSTRTVYQKKLATAMRENMKGDLTAPDSSVNMSLSDVENNNLGETTVEIQETTENTETTTEELKDADFSADDEADPYQPSCVISPTLNSKSVMSNDSFLSFKKSEDYPSLLRQRFDGLNKEAELDDSRYTPTARRSIHSYEVTENSKETVTKAKDGTISKEYKYTKTTSTIASEIGAVERFGKFLLCILLFLIIAGAGYHIYALKEEHEIVPAKCLMAKLQDFFYFTSNQFSQTKPEAIDENISVGTENSSTWNQLSQEAVDEDISVNTKI